MIFWAVCGPWQIGHMGYPPVNPGYRRKRHTRRSGALFGPLSQVTESRGAPRATFRFNV